MPWARRELVERRRWLSEAEYAELFGLCQILPGANVANLSVVFGARSAGPAGAVAALTGLVAAPVAIALLLATITTQFSGQPWFAGLMRGLAAGGAGLLAATAFRMARPFLTRWRTAAFIALAVVLLESGRVPLLPSLLLLLPLALVTALPDAA